jgi:hypothetical protein
MVSTIDKPTDAVFIVREKHYIMADKSGCEHGVCISWKSLRI